MEVDVEHILPKSVVSKLTENKNLTKKVKQWIMDLDYEVPTTRRNKESLGKKLLPSLNKLGNQALLDLKMNRALKDSPFPEKKDCYGMQVLELTNSLTDREEWKLDQILVRQKGMAERAPAVWPK